VYNAGTRYGTSMQKQSLLVVHHQGCLTKEEFTELTSNEEECQGGFSIRNNWQRAAVASACCFSWIDNDELAGALLLAHTASFFFS